jgi:hypothetical protein
MDASREANDKENRYLWQPVRKLRRPLNQPHAFPVALKNIRF